MQISEIEIALGSLLLAALGMLFGAAVSYGVLSATVKQLESLVRDLRGEVLDLRTQINALQISLAEVKTRIDPRHMS